MIKALFFDIDGTLVSFKTHHIPQSTVEALTKAHDDGVRIYISTGRPIPFITNLEQITALIDGYITTNGALCRVNNECFGLHVLLKDDVRTVLTACRDKGRSCVVVGTEHIATFQETPTLKRQFVDYLGLKDFHFSSLDEVMEEPILQVSPFFTMTEEAEVMPRLQACVSGRWSEVFTDITHVDADKGKGLESMAKHEGINIAETMAFGDGGNDISIIKRAGIGVAMGNAGVNVKAIADYVTKSVDEGGVSWALKLLREGKIG